MPEARHIGISVGKLRPPSDGLGEFAVQLGQRISERAPELLDQYGVRLHFYMDRAQHGLFGDQVHYLARDERHKFRHKSALPFAVWHTIDQHNKTAPPKGTPVRLMTVHDYNFLYFKRGRKWLEDMIKSRWLLARTDRVIAISQHVKADVETRMRFRGPVDVIYNGARDLTTHPQQPVDGLIPQRFFFHLSRMASSKNPRALLDLAAIWPEETFVLAGARNADSEAIAAEVAQRHLGNVRILMDINDSEKAWLYANARAFQLPSLTEGFGLPPIEAMHFGCPVYLSDRTCLPEIGGTVAHYWTQFDPHHMKQVMQAGMLQDDTPNARRLIREHASQFSWSSCAQRYVDLYLACLPLQPGSSR